MDRKKCVICKNKINFTSERYVKLIDYNGKKQLAHCFYHLDCWNDEFASKLFYHVNNVIKKHLKLLDNNKLSDLELLQEGKIKNAS